MLKALQVGTYAPNFLTYGVINGRLGRFRLSDYRGKKYVILLFYAANFNSVSTNELLTLNKSYKKFQHFSAQVLAISMDTPFSHLHFLRYFRRKYKSPSLYYPLISDLTQRICKRYHVITVDGLCLPAVFIIDKYGVIQYHSENSLLCGRNINDILRALQSIQALRKVRKTPKPKPLTSLERLKRLRNYVAEQREEQEVWDNYRKSYKNKKNRERKRKWFRFR